MSERLKHRSILSIVSGLLLLPFIFSFNASGTELPPAGRSDDFVNSMGVCTHPPDYPAYQNTNMVTTNLAVLGIRYTRCDGYNQNWVWDYWNMLYTKYGVKRIEIFFPYDSLTNWTISNMVGLVDKYPAMMAGVEEPNETDFGNISYDNTNFPQATIDFQNDLYNAMKADSIASNFPVLAPSVGKSASDSVDLVGCELDFENMHSYAGGLLPDNGLASYWIYNANKIITPSKPVVATECGWHTAVNLTNDDEPGVSERAQGKYIPRLFAEYWNQGAVCASTYELLDEGTNLLNSQDCYGIVHNDGTPKPAFTAEKNMIALLADPGDSFIPGILGFSLSGSTNNVHQTLLQKGGETLYLLLWQDVLCYDITNKVDITNTSVAVTLNLPTNIISATMYSYDDSGNLSTSATTIVSNAISLSVPDSMLFVQLISSFPLTPTLIKDNADATGITVNGSWTVSTSSPDYYGLNYLHDDNAGGGKSVQFTPTILTTGNYNVYVNWTSGVLRATNAPIDVNYAAGKATFYENQQTNGGKWNYLGQFQFNAGTNGNVTIRDDGASSYVVADAVEFILSTPLVAPTLTATGTNKQVLLSWSASPAAAGYNVKRSKISGGPYTVIASVAATNYVDNAVTNGITYYYVATTFANGSESINSPEVSATPNAATIAPILGLPYLTNGALEFTIDAGPNSSCGIQRSTNLVNWMMIFTTNSAAPHFQFSDFTISNLPVSFYRLMIFQPSMP